MLSKIHEFATAKLNTDIKLLPLQEKEQNQRSKIYDLSDINFHLVFMMQEQQRLDNESSLDQQYPQSWGL